jgi:hypothetical protein
MEPVKSGRVRKKTWKVDSQAKPRQSRKPLSPAPLPRQLQVPTASPTPEPALAAFQATQDVQAQIGPLTMLAQAAELQVGATPQARGRESVRT